MTDDLSGIFENLTVADFERSSVRYVEDSKMVLNFSDWVDEQIQTVRVAWVASDGLINPIAVMRTREGKTLIFGPDDDETLAQWAERLGREAKRNNASWFFTTVMTVGGTYMTNTEVRAIDNPDVMEEAEKKADLKPVIFFHAQRKNEPGMEDALRHGMIAINDNMLGDVMDAPPEHASPIYTKVLG